MNTKKTLIAMGALLMLASAVPSVASAQMAPSATVSAAPSAIDIGEVRSLVADRLARQLPIGRVQIDIDPRTLDVTLPGNRMTVLGLENFTFNATYGRFSGELVVAPATAVDATRRLQLAGRAWSLIEVPTLARRINPGDVIDGGDLAWVEVRADFADADIAMAPSDLVGRTPRRLLPANTPVRLHDLQLPRMIAKNAVVTLMLQTRAMTLTTQGRALQEGGKGEVIRVLNTQSNRSIDAVVAGPNLVMVNVPGSIN